MMQKSEIRKLLTKLISLDSRYPREEKIGNYLHTFLKKHDFKVTKQKVIKNRSNIFAEKGFSKGKKAILFLGHLDTVDTTFDESWKTYPLKASEISKKVYGLGSSDMKGGIVAFLEATKKYGGYVKILLTIDEENYSEGGWFAVNNKSNFFKDVELVISAEPNLGAEAHEIANGRSGRCIFNVDITGKSEHILKYKEATDAIQVASEFINKLYNSREKFPKDKNTIIQVRKVFAESVGMSVCGNVNLEVEVILGAKDSIRGIQKALKLIAGKDKVILKERKTPYLESYQIKEIPYKLKINEVVKKHTGQEVKFYFRKSVADDNVLASLGLPVITWGVKGGNEHKANEYVDLPSLYELAEMYEEFLAKVD